MEVEKMNSATVDHKRMPLFGASIFNTPGFPAFCPLVSPSTCAGLCPAPLRRT